MLSFNFTPFPTIETERLLLRAVSIDDAPDLHVMRKDERILTYLNRDPDKSMEETNNLIKLIMQNLQNNEAVLWGITLKENPATIIGTIGYWHVQPENHRAEIGYMLHPDHWKKGLMKEALQAVIPFGFNSMKLHSIEANINPDNKPSCALVESCGFIREAYFKENYYYNGVFYDSAIYSLLNK